MTAVALEFCLFVPCASHCEPPCVSAQILKPLANNSKHLTGRVSWRQPLPPTQTRGGGGGGATIVPGGRGREGTKFHCLLSRIFLVNPKPFNKEVDAAALFFFGGGLLHRAFSYPPPPLYKLRPCPSYSRRRDRINLGPNFNSVRNIAQPHKTWVS